MSWSVSLEGVSVLVVDDNPDGRELAALMLRTAGAKVATAASCTEALEQLSSGWDLVLTDISMSGGSGYDLIREARLQGSLVPMIAFTAFATSEHRRKVLSSGFAEYLTKPITPEQLLASVAEVVARPPVVVEGVGLLQHEGVSPSSDSSVVPAAQVEPTPRR